MASNGETHPKIRKNWPVTSKVEVEHTQIIMISLTHFLSFFQKGEWPKTLPRNFRKSYEIRGNFRYHNTFILSVPDIFYALLLVIQESLIEDLYLVNKLALLRPLQLQSARKARIRPNSAYRIPVVLVLVM